MPIATRHYAYIIFICLAVVVVFASGINGVFVLDDTHQIIDNLHIRTWSPPWAPLIGTTRPLVQALNALNYAISGLATWSYHIVNIALHVGAALALYGLARRTLARIPVTEERAAGLAVAGTIIWAVHPLQTESVTYVIQRAEVAMGLAIFLMLYCFVRATESPRPARWLIGSLAACVAGYTAKPIMVIAPLLLWLFDRHFISGSFRAAWRARPRFYLALVLSPLVIPLLLAADPSEWRDSAGVGSLPVTWYEYAATQPEIILHYLRLTIWPTPLCLDYGWPIQRSPAVIAATSLVIVAAIGLTLFGFIKKRPWGFLGAWFIVNLAPTSSVIPIADLAFEHRMYLALAAVSFAVVVGIYLALRDRASKVVGTALTVAAVIYFSIFTDIRNRDYTSAIRLWAKNVAARPDYPRARNNLGLELAREGRFEEAILQLRKAIELKPEYAIAHQNLGTTLLDAGRPGDARTHLEKALTLSPDNPRIHAELGRAYQKLGDSRGAVAHFASAARLNQGDITAWLSFSSALVEIRRHSDAVKVLEQALRTHANSPRIMRALAVLLAAAPEDRVRDPGRALELAQRSLALEPHLEIDCLDALGMALAANGEYDAAINAAQTVVAAAREQNAPLEVITAMELRLARYRAGQPWRMDAPLSP